MAANDAIVLQANFSQWKAERAAGLTDIDLWLYYAVSQFLKAYELNDEEIQYGITEGGKDGGADGLYFLVNHRILVRDDATIDTKSVTSVRVIIIQVKEYGGFRPTEIDKHIEFANDFFDLSKNAKSFSFRYNENVIKQMAIFKELYLKSSGNFPTVNVDFYYITGADVVPDEYARDSGNRVTQKVNSHLSQARATYNFIAAQQLWEQVQKRPPRTKTLRWSGTPMETQGGYVGLVNIHTLYDFLQDEPGVLAERIFESNIRGYQQDTPVNKQIRASLDDRYSLTNFWTLNNGITIISTGVGSAGHLALNVSDPQIVNGLQTSREIFNHFNRPPANGGDDPRVNDSRSVLVRVLIITDEAAQDAVIRATNSQNQLAPSSFRMTDQIHRDIEGLFKSYDLYYDRRKGFHKDQGRPIKRIVTVTSLTQAMIAIILQRPDDARGRPGDYFKEQRRYDSIFGGSSIELPVYVRCIGLLRRIEAYLGATRIKSADAKNIKFHMATDLSCELTKVNRPWPAKLLDMPDPETVDDATVAASFTRVNSLYEELAIEAEKDDVARGSEFAERLLTDIKQRFPAIRRRAAIVRRQAKSPLSKI
jgi:hypothetical protein